jgi:hypothetical protein
LAPKTVPCVPCQAQNRQGSPPPSPFSPTPLLSPPLHLSHHLAPPPEHLAPPPRPWKTGGRAPPHLAPDLVPDPALAAPPLRPRPAHGSSSGGMARLLVAPDGFVDLARSGSSPGGARRRLRPRVERLVSLACGAGGWRPLVSPELHRDPMDF